VAWSTFATGVNPGGHGVFDFLRRDPRTYLPELALSGYERGSAFTGPKAVNRRKGTPVWNILSSAGIASTIIRCPCTFPPEPILGRMLSGMGVPDLRGSQGTGTFYTTAEDATAGEGEQVVVIRADARGSFVTRLVGPRITPGAGGLELDLTIDLDPEGDRVVLRSSGMTPSAVEVRAGRWSDWLRLRFPLGRLRTVRGMVRFRLTGGGPDFGLYCSPIHFDPEVPLYPISAPKDYARALAMELGPYYTAGMVEDHAGLNNGRIDERAFLEQCTEVWDQREAMLVDGLERAEEGLVFCLFDTSDRVQHMFWRFREPGHPAHRGRAVPAEFSRTVDDQYRRGVPAGGTAMH
jgi:predicted AlkP superfamily phosphohydrolase/phosphomutase